MLFAATVAAGLAAPSGKTSAWALTTVTGSQLTDAGIELTPPQEPVPASAVSAAAAGAAASAGENNAAVLDVHYQHCTDTWQVSPPLSEDCYAVSLDPSAIAAEMPSSLTGPAPTPTWAVALVGPSGQVIEMRAGT
jgi:hypothetical protein